MTPRFPDDASALIRTVRGFSRRSFLALAPFLRLGDTFPSESRRFRDAATEFEILRLTDPSHSSWLPPQPLKAISRRSDFLVFSSDRSGSPQAYRLELRTGVIRELSEAENLDPNSLCLSPDDRSLAFLDGPTLMHGPLMGPKRSLAEPSAGAVWCSPPVFLTDRDILIAENALGRFRVRWISTLRRSNRVLLESARPIQAIHPRPARDAILCTAEGQACAYKLNGALIRELQFSGGTTSSFLWSRNERSVFYLLFPEDRRRLHQLRLQSIDSGEDRLIASTSQFITFASNGDESVFVGASMSRAAPHILLLLRKTRRELTLCEHKAIDPSRLVVRFSPDSQWIYFHTDRQQRFALYAMNVERLVEKTPEEIESREQSER